MKHSNSSILEFKSTKNPIKVLGTFLSYNQNKNIEENFLSRIRKMKIKLNLWLSRDLTLYGRSLLAKTLGVSQLVYAASMLTVQSLVIKNVQNRAFFIIVEKQKRQDKKNGHVPTSFGRRSQFCKLFCSSKIFAPGVDKSVIKQHHRLVESNSKLLF